ncbi:MAG: shikimate kinase [bacterium]|nr:shikimate kinase [bacterium]
MRGLTLIGMPAVGKSTIGRLVAEKLALNFIDLDNYISDRDGRSPVNIIKEDGEDAFVALEEKCALELDLHNTIFAPGGSIIYSSAAIEAIKEQTKIFYLFLPLDEIEKRLKDRGQLRGIIGWREGLRPLYKKRSPLYEKAADCRIDIAGIDNQKIVASLIEKYRLK